MHTSVSATSFRSLESKNTESVVALLPASFGGSNGQAQVKCNVNIKVNKMHGTVKRYWHTDFRK